MSKNDDNNSNLSSTQMLALGFGLALVIIGISLAIIGTGDIFDNGDDIDYDFDENITENGFTNQQQILQQHSNILRNSSYEITIESSNSQSSQSGQTTYRYSSESQYGLSSLTGVNGSTTEVFEDYSSSELLIAQNLTTDNATYQSTPLTRQPYTADQTVGQVLSLADITATEVQENEDGSSTIVYEIDSSSVDNNQTGSISGEIHYNDNGYFTYVDVTRETTNQLGQTVQLQQTVDITNIDSTTVEEPEWVSEARQQTEEVDYDFSENITRSGFESPENVTNEHADYLQEDSYTVELNTTNSAVQQSRQSVYQYNRSSNIAFSTQSTGSEIFEDYNESEVIAAQGLGTENVTYERRTLDQDPYTASTDILQFLNLGEFRATDVIENSDGSNTLVYTIEGVSGNQSQIQSLSGELRYNDNGYFESLDVTFEQATQSGQNVTVSQQIVVSDIGSTVVSTPEWVEEARSQTEDPNSTEDN